MILPNPSLSTCPSHPTQEEEDRAAEARLQRRFRELEAAEAAAAGAVEEERSGWGGWPGGRGRRRGSGSGAAAAAAAAGGGLPRAGGRGPRQQRARRSPAAEANFAAAMQGVFAPPLGAGYGGRGRGGFFGEALQHMLGGLHRGLPANLLLRWAWAGKGGAVELLEPSGSQAAWELRVAQRILVSGSSVTCVAQQLVTPLVYHPAPLQRPRLHRR